MRFHDKINKKLLEKLFEDDFEYNDGIDGVEMIYNFIPKFVLISIALSMGKKLEIIGDEDKSQNKRTEDIWSIWENNNMQTLKYKIAKHFFLYGQINLEAVLEEGPDKLKSTKIILHEPESVEIEKVGDKIIKVKISSEDYVDNKKVKIEKIITPEKITLKIGDNTEEKINLYDTIPFIRVDNSNWRIKGLLRYQDRLNLYEYYLDALFDLHADPMLYDDLGESFNEKKIANKETNIKISNERRKIRKILHYPSSSQGLRILESNGAMAQRIQEQQNNIWNTCKTVYPEIVLMELLKSSGQISGVGIEKKLIEINSSINLARGQLKNGLEELNELISWLIFNVKIKTQIQFEDIIPKTLSDILTEVSQATGLLSKNWQLEMLQKEGIINSAEEELKNQNKADQSNPLGW